MHNSSLVAIAQYFWRIRTSVLYDNRKKINTEAVNDYPPIPFEILFERKFPTRGSLIYYNVDVYKCGVVYTGQDTDRRRGPNWTPPSRGQQRPMAGPAATRSRTLHQWWGPGWCVRAPGRETADEREVEVAGRREPPEVTRHHHHHIITGLRRRRPYPLKTRSPASWTDAQTFLPAIMSVQFKKTSIILDATKLRRSGRSAPWPPPPHSILLRHCERLQSDDPQFINPQRKLKRTGTCVRHGTISCMSGIKLSCRPSVWWRSTNGLNSLLNIKPQRQPAKYLFSVAFVTILLRYLRVKKAMQLVRQTVDEAAASNSGLRVAETLGHSRCCPRVTRSCLYFVSTDDWLLSVYLCDCRYNWVCISSNERQEARTASHQLSQIANDCNVKFLLSSVRSALSCLVCQCTHCTLLPISCKSLASLLFFSSLIN